MQHFHSRPDLQPPALAVTARSPQTTPGDIFTAPYSGPGQSGPMIFDEAGNLVWFDPLPAGTEATNLQVQQLDGQAGADAGGRATSRRRGSARAKR